MKEYHISYTRLAEQDLRGIYEYIAFTLLAPETAANQSNRIIDAVAGLNQLPERFRRYDREPWHSMGLRIMPVDNYVVLYTVSKLSVGQRDEVSIVRVLYSGRDIDSELTSSRIRR